MRYSSRKLYVIGFVIVLILLGIYLLGQKEVEAARVTVEITRSMPLAPNDPEREGLIGNVSLTKVYVKKLSAPRGSDMYMPGISVGLFRNMVMISDWTSVPLADKGVYELTVGLNQRIDKGDVVRIAVYVNDNKGDVIIGKRRDIVWG